MEWDSASANGMDIATKISDFQKDELERFMRDHLRRKDLHRVVANLNASVLSKDSPRSKAARTALNRMGFPD